RTRRPRRAGRWSVTPPPIAHRQSPPRYRVPGPDCRSSASRAGSGGPSGRRCARRCETQRSPPARPARPARRARRQTAWDSSGAPVPAVLGGAVLEHAAAAAVPVLTGRRTLATKLGAAPRAELVASLGPADQRGRAYRAPPLPVWADSPPVGHRRIGRGTLGAEMPYTLREAQDMAALVTMDTYAGMGL